MIADTINYQNLIHRSEPLIRPASMVSFLTHIIIIGIAVYGLPNFGRKLPPDFTVISFELLKVVEETNLDLTVKINPEKNIVIGFGITDKTISALKSANGLVVGSMLCKSITNSLKMRQNPVTKLDKVVYNLRSKIL